MTFNLDNVVPWGRSLKEYTGMFALEAKDLRLSILDCGGGPSSFNSEMTNNGKKIISCDPLYKLSASDIKHRTNETYDKVLKETIKNKDNYIWDTIKSPEELGNIRKLAMDQFLIDFEKGKTEGRYLPASLPDLPFKDDQFELALSSHFLFLYTGILSLDFHKKAILEMCRVAKEVRIFPLLDLQNQESAYLNDILNNINNEFNFEIIKIEYEFQKEANKMLRIFPKNPKSTQAIKNVKGGMQ